ncbi:MAG: twitch domain-containing radical SAM protein [Candidatus Marinimicrobia bacterium]|nr:twitch domain-containing radical SAM protein [Candidatus Neomarinimicrobiota bacterium]
MSSSVNEIKGCILPWMHMMGNLNGEYHACCFAKYHHGDDVLGFHNQSLLDVWNNPPYKNLRNQLLKGEIPAECNEVCFGLEDSGGVSNRQQVNHRFQQYAHLQNQTEADGYQPTIPKYLDIRFGNLCNFRCRMCGPKSSTGWYEEVKINNGKIIDPFTENELFWKDVSIIAPHLSDVYFAGGEPFLQNGHYKLIEYLISTGHSRNISLQYNSNLSHRNYKNFDLKQLWSHFKQISIWPSCEGFGEKVEYSRSGFNWKLFEENCRYFKREIDTVSAVINIYSISSMPELILWCKQQGIDYWGTILTHPDYLNITSLPKKGKDFIREEYRSFQTEATKLLNEHDLNQINNWITYMDSKDNSHLLPKFKEIQQKLDYSRRETFQLVFPEFSDWYDRIN